MKRILIPVLLMMMTTLKSSDLSILTGALQNQRFWTAVHAAEYLIELKRAPEAIACFLDRQRTAETVPVNRIGIWRVRAQQFAVSEDMAGYNQVIELLRQAAFASGDAPDRIHGLETLFKLNYQCNDAEQKQLEIFISASDSPLLLQIYSAALLSWADSRRIVELVRLFRQHSSDKLACSVLLYVLQKYPVLPEELLKQVSELYKNSPEDDQRIAAAWLLLKHRKMSTATIPKIPEKLCKTYLQILREYLPQSSRYNKVLQQMKRSCNIEMQMYAVYIALKDKAGNVK